MMDIDAMIKDYRDGMGTSAIAKKYGLKSAGSAQYYLQKAGVFVPKIQRDERTVEELHKQGWAADRIAAEVGIKREKVLEMTKWKGEPKPPPKGGQLPQFLKGVEPVKIHGTNHKTTEDLDRLMKEVAGSLTDEQIASFKKKPNGKQSKQDVHDKQKTTNKPEPKKFKETCAKDTNAHESVNHPDHYNRSGIETITIIEMLLTEEEYRGFLKGNILKYRERAPYKGNAEEDYKKAKWYFDELMTIGF